MQSWLILPAMMAFGTTLAQGATQPQAAGDIWRQTYLSNPLWAWLALVGLLAGAVLVGRMLSFVFARYGRMLIQRDRGRLLGLFLQALAGPITLLLAAGAMFLASTFMQFSYSLPELFGKGGREPLELHWLWLVTAKTLSVLAGGWALYRMVSVFEAIFQRWASRSHSGMEGRMIPIIRKIIRGVIVIVVGLFIAQNVLNWNIAALLAGFGLTGLAVALAAQDALKNFFGSVAIFADQPFHIGEWVKINNHDGFVEEVGFRSTRLRTPDGTLVVIPNSLIATVAVQNFSRNNVLSRTLNLPLKALQPDQLQQALDIISKLLADHRSQLADKYPPSVGVQDISPAGITIAVTYWFAPADLAKAQEFHSRLCQEIYRRLFDAKIALNLPA